jgi:hypothetical protein
MATRLTFTMDFTKLKSVLGELREPLKKAVAQAPQEAADARELVPVTRGLAARSVALPEVAGAITVRLS